MNAVTGLLFHQKSKIQNQQSHWLAFVHKGTDKTARLGQSQRAPQGLERLIFVTCFCEDQRLEHQSFYSLMHPARLLGRNKQPGQQS